MSNLKLLFGIALIGIFGASAYIVFNGQSQLYGHENSINSHSAHEPGFDSAPDNLFSDQDYSFGNGGWYTLSELRNFVRPEGPKRVGLQIGHWQHRLAPEELSGLRGNTGAVYEGFTELDLMLELGDQVARQLRAAGITVDVLPVTVPPKYVADAFISLHADGNLDTSIRGFKIAGPRRDYSGISDILVDKLRESYRAVTGLPEDPQVTRRMTAYYAFNWARYKHAVHPYTPVAIVETGFVTNTLDRNFLINDTEVAARAISNGIISFLEVNQPINPPLELLRAPQLPIQGTITCAPLRSERQNTREYDCEPSIQIDTETFYLLADLPDEIDPSTPFRATITGSYLPAQTLENYFWFPYEIRGIISQAAIVD